MFRIAAIVGIWVWTVAGCLGSTPEPGAQVTVDVGTTDQRGASDEGRPDDDASSSPDAQPVVCNGQTCPDDRPLCDPLLGQCIECHLNPRVGECGRNRYCGADYRCHTAVWCHNDTHCEDLAETPICSVNKGVVQFPDLEARCVECREDEHCPEGQECWSFMGTCAQPCEDVPEGKFCINGNQVYDVVACADDAECPDGYYCSLHAEACRLQNCVPGYRRCRDRCDERGISWVTLSELELCPDCLEWGGELYCRECVVDTRICDGQEARKCEKVIIEEGWPDVPTVWTTAYGDGVDCAAAGMFCEDGQCVP